MRITEEIPDTDHAYGACYDTDLVYRYAMWRSWQPRIRPEQMVAFIGVNPPVTDESEKDATHSRCVNLAKRWGYAGVVLVNLFALCVTKPMELKRDTVRDPVGPENDEMLESIAFTCPQIVLAWGNHGGFLNRDCEVIAMLNQNAAGKIVHLGLTTAGFPKHPQYVRDTVKRTPWF